MARVRGRETEVARAARWLRGQLDGAGWVPVGTLAALAGREGFNLRMLQRARVRAGVGFRRVGFPPRQHSEWRLVEPATLGYRPDRGRRIDPLVGRDRDVVASCDVCGRAVVLGLKQLPVDCLTPGCDGLYQATDERPEPYPSAPSRAAASIVESDAADDRSMGNRPPRVRFGDYAICPVCGYRQLVVEPGRCQRHPLCAGMFRLAD